MKEGKTAAIVVAAGKGQRFGGEVPKQYCSILDKPVLYYALSAYEKSKVDFIVVVVGSGEEDYVQKEIVLKYGLLKVCQVICGGKERYDSVYAGLKALESSKVENVLIHDGARPLISPELINKTILAVQRETACVLGIPARDTVKMVDSEGFISNTPARSLVWMIQTPQAFSYSLIQRAYEIFLDSGVSDITDDAMIVERMTNQKVRVVEGDFFNLKITTKEDLELARIFLERRSGVL